MEEEAVACNGPAEPAQLTPLMRMLLRGLHAERLIRSPAVIELDPVANHAAGMLQRLKAVPMYTLLFQGPDQPLDQPVLLRSMWRDELLPQSVAAHERSIAANGEDQAVIGT